MSDENSVNMPIGTKTAARAAQILSGFFPQSGVSDPQIFMGGLVTLLAHYPAWLIDRLCDPFGGLPSKYTFLPAINIIKDECEALYAHVRRDQERERIRAETKFLLAAPPEQPRAERMSYEQIKAKHGDGNGGWGIGKPRERPGFKPIPIEELHRLAGDEWDKIPDAKDYDFTKLDSAAKSIIEGLK